MKEIVLKHLRDVNCQFDDEGNMQWIDDGNIIDSIYDCMIAYSDQQNAELRKKLMLLEDTIKHQSERCLRMEDVITELKADVDHNFKRALEIADEREEARDKVQDLESAQKIGYKDGSLSDQCMMFSDDYNDGYTPPKRPIPDRTPDNQMVMPFVLDEIGVNELEVK